MQHAGVIGATLSHYLVERPLGAGGMGAVYLARDLALGRMAAVKVVADAFEPAVRQRLQREAEASARLQHPAIATFYEIFDDWRSWFSRKLGFRVAQKTGEHRVPVGAVPEAGD